MFTRMLPAGTRTLYAFIFWSARPCSIKRQLSIDIFGVVTRRFKRLRLSDGIRIIVDGRGDGARIVYRRIGKGRRRFWF